MLAIWGGKGVCRLSSVIESEPWGFSSDNKFLNVGVAFDDDREPMVMLRDIHRIERQLGSASHRDAQGNYVDRLVDIDIVAIDERVIDLPDLQVPHPRLPQREFFLRPLAELAPQWTHPTLRATPHQLLQSL